MNTTGVAIVDHVGLKAGMECYDFELYTALKNTGCAPMVYSNFSNPAEGIVPAFRFQLKENLVSFFRLLRTYDKISAELKSKQVKNCILHGFRFGFWEWVILKKVKRSSAEIFLIVHDPGSLIGKNTISKWRKKIFELSSRIIVHNKFCLAQLSDELTAAEKEKLLIIPHGNFLKSAVQPTDTEKFMRGNNLSPGRKHLLFFGQIKETKGLDILLEAFANIESDTDLIIAGRMRKHSFAQYQGLIDKHNLRDRVKLFIGYISPAMRNEFFQLADAVVLPYRKVYQSGVLLMAMSYGKAVIASDLPPNREIIVDGENGFLFESENSKDLARVISEVISNEDKRVRAANGGLHFVKESRDWNRIAVEWNKLFQT